MHIGVILARLSSIGISPVFSEGSYSSWRGWARLLLHCLRIMDLLSDHFDSKRSREAVDLPLTCHPSPSLTAFAFRSSEVRRLLLDLASFS